MRGINNEIDSHFDKLNTILQEEVKFEEELLTLSDDINNFLNR